MSSVIVILDRTKYYVLCRNSRLDFVLPKSSLALSFLFPFRLNSPGSTPKPLLSSKPPSPSSPSSFMLPPRWTRPVSRS